MQYSTHHYRLARAGLSQAGGLLAIMAFLLFFISPAQAQLSGTYTICKSGCDYSSFSAAASALKSNGVNGPVTFNVAAETFQERVTFNNYSGVSAKNTITFAGAGKSSTRIYYSSGNTVYLSSAQYLRFKDMTIENTGTSGTRRAVYMSSSKYNIFENNILTIPNSNSSGYVVYMSGSSSYNEFNQNRIDGGYYGVYNSLSSSYNYGYNKYVENEIRNFYYYGMIMYYSWKNEYLRNNIDSAAYTYAYGIYSYREGATLIEGNRIPGEKMYYGIRVYYPNYYKKSDVYKVQNNMIGGVDADMYYGIYDYNYGQKDANVEYNHNTIEMGRSGAWCLYIYDYNGGGKYYIRNNMFTNSTSGGTLFGMYVATSSDEIEGNNYYMKGGGNFSLYNGTYYNSYATYTKAANPNGHALNSSNISPEYVAGDDLHWDPKKPAPSGPFAGVTTDIDGDTRCNLFPTVGADESNFGKSKPVVQIFGNSTVIQGTPTVFYNSAKAGEPKVHKWYIDGVLQSDSIHLETTKLSGPSHVIKLVTLGCGGSDSATLNVSVQLPTKAPVSDFIADKNSVLMGSTINFFDLSTNGPSQWSWEIKPDSTYDFGLKVPTVKMTYGDLSSPKWQGRFNYPGKYQICLTASNSKGKGNKECKTDYIEVIPSINMSSTTIIKDPKGYLYDNGGPNGSPSYNNSGSYTALIDPCADSVYLIIKDFELYCNYDYLQIYEGKDDQGRVLHTCTGNTGYYGKDGYTGSNQYTCANDCRPTLGDTFKAAGSMYIVLDIKSGVTQSGIEAYWWSKPKSSQAPVASFTAVDTICTNGVVAFTNTSTGDEVDYQWDLDGDLSFFESNAKNSTWPYFFPGQYTVTLIAKNCGGIDTFSKTITVLDPPTPVVDLKADNTNPTTNDVVFFTSTTAECVDKYEWIFTKKYGTGTITYVNGTSKSSPAPQVVFSDTGLWSVEMKATNVTGSGNKVKTDYINVKGSYCNPSVSNTLPDIGISKVVFHEINNSSNQGVNGYENYTPTISTTIEIGVTYDLTVERTSNKNKANRTAWIDWNGDGDFDDAGELVADENNSSALSWTESITVPSAATVGATKMRIAINQSNYGNKVCGQNEFGEYEDYRIYITPDLTAPVITMKGMDTVMVEQGFAYIDSGATAVDNLNGNITKDIVLTSAPTFNALIPGTYVFSYNVEDKAGNKAETRKRVVIIGPDVTAPALRIAKPDTLIVGVNEQYDQLKVLSADDLVDGDMRSYVSINDPVNPAVVGMYTVTYSVSDFSNNDTIVRRYVNVIDSSAPMITMIGSDTVYHDVNTNYIDSGVVLSDNYYTKADLNAALVTSNNVDENELGTYVVNYTLTDPSGNAAETRTRVVVVVDREAPVLTMIDDDMVKLEVYNSYIDQGIMIDDNYYTITGWDTAGTFYTAFPDGEATKLGTYTIIYEVTDPSGNMASITRTIEVVDETAPEITLKQDPTVTLCRWAEYEDGGYDLSDNFYASSDITVIKEGSFITDGGTDLPGFYSFRYMATDGSGNVAYSDFRYIYVMSEYSTLCQSGIDKGDDLSKHISVYPNPNSGKFNVTTDLPGSDRVRISVTNTLGQEVAVISNGAMGSNTFAVDLSDQANGVYIIKVVNNNYSITKQIVISK